MGIPFKFGLGVTVLLIVLAASACAQRADVKNYENSDYSLSYPSSWAVTDKNGIVNVFPASDTGAVTISVHRGITFPLEETKSFILEMNELTDNPETVKMVTHDHLTEFTHEYVDAKKKVHWFTRILRKESNLYLITINCREDLWAEQKAGYLAIINSFRIKR